MRKNRTGHEEHSDHDTDLILAKEKGQDLHLWEGAVKEEKFPHTGKPLHWQR